MNVWLVVAGWVGLSIPVALAVGAMAGAGRSSAGRAHPVVLGRRRNVAAH